MTFSSPQREFAVEIVRALRDAGHVALFAGGCVRDLLLGRPAKDYDVATTARPEQVRELFGHKWTLPVGASFGVIIVLPRRRLREALRELDPNGHCGVEVATFRTEGPYLDGRRPEQVSFCTPEEDASRRDFTINGMFYDPIESRVLDYVGGEADLAARIVRAIGNPHDRMREDKLRMLRAVRFAATLEFELDPATADAVREMASDLTIVSAERIAQEFKKMLANVHRERAIALCESTRLLDVVIPELSRAPSPGHHPGVSDEDWRRSLRMLALRESPSFELAFATLLFTLPARPTVNGICRRLKLSNDETERIVWLVEHQNDLLDAPSQSLARLKRTLAHPFRDDLLTLLRVKLLAAEADMRPVLFCDEYLTRTPEHEINPPLLLTGDDLKSLGLKPGPAFKRILDTVRDAQLNGEISTPDDAAALARQHAAAH
jgi:poly(A) polymerase